jgi:hypothetical protein
MQNSQPSIPEFMPISCAEVSFSAACGEEWLGAATWVGVVISDTPRLFATLIDQPDRAPAMAGDFSLRLPLDDRPKELSLERLEGPRSGASMAVVHIECHGTSSLEHGRLLLCGEVSAVYAEDSTVPWLAPLLRIARTAPERPLPPRQ